MIGDKCPYCGAERIDYDHSDPRSMHDNWACGTYRRGGEIFASTECDLRIAEAEIEQLKADAGKWLDALRRTLNDKQHILDELANAQARLRRYEAIIETLKDGVNTLLTTNPNQDLINDALEVLADLEVS